MGGGDLEIVCCPLQEKQYYGEREQKDNVES